MKVLISAMLTLMTTPMVCGASAPPQEALELLIAGNQRFVKDKLLHPNRDDEVRSMTAKGQTPFGIILGCSDSRVAPEILFDLGIGDLFVVRVAGNVAGPIEISSIEYAALVLGSSVLMVLGHENCGAVTAVLDGKGEAIEPIAELIAPAIRGVKTIEEAVRDNVEYVARQLEATPSLTPLIQEGKLVIVGGVYHLETGKVELVTPRNP